MVEISVVIPCYNASKSIRSCIDSVLAQSFQNFEVIAIDDASTDNTLNSLRSYDDKRLRIIEMANNSGSPAAPRNVGIKESKGIYIAFLDSDDFWQPDKLLKQVRYMKETKCQFSCTDYFVREIDGSEYKRKALSQAKIADLLERNSVGCSTVMIAKDLISNFQFRNCPHEDFDMWLQILEQHNIVYGLGECLSTYVKQKNSRSRLSLRNILGFHSLFKLHGKVGNLGAFILMIRYHKNKMSQKLEH